MSDRLQKLLRQRALIQEHLAWLDREIDDAKGIPPLPNTPAARPPLTILAATTPTTPPAAAPSDEAEKILGQYNLDASVVSTDARRGCLMMFFIGLGIFVLTLAIGYYFYARHLGRWW